MRLYKSENEKACQARKLVEIVDKTLSFFTDRTSLTVLLYDFITLLYVRIDSTKTDVIFKSQMHKIRYEYYTYTHTHILR